MDEYYRIIDWKFFPEDIVQDSIDNYTLTAIPINTNEPGADPRTVGNYIVDYVGHRYQILSSTATTITIFDEYGTGEAPQTGKIARVYQSVVDGVAPYVGSVDYSTLDLSARWKVNGADKEIMWKELDNPFDYIQFNIISAPDPLLEGRIMYTPIGDLQIGNKFGTVEGAISTDAETYIATESILIGQVVRISGYDSPGLITASLASNVNYNENWKLGMASTNALTGEAVRVIFNGLVAGWDTSVYPTDVELYLGTIPGSLVSERPIFPALPYVIGINVVPDVDGIMGIGVSIDQYDQTFDGCVIEKQDGEFRFDGANVYLDIEKLGGGDLPVQLGSKTYIYNCTTGPGSGGKGTVQLVQGTTETIVLNMIYFHLVGGVLTLSTTTTYPVDPFSQVGYVALKDYTTSTTYGPILTRRITSAKNHSGRGRVSYMMERSTIQGCQYWDGMQPSATITPGTPDIVNVTTLAGYFYQNHRQDWPIVDLGLTGAIVLNASGNGDLTPMQIVYNLAECDELADGTPVNNRRMHIVVVGLGNAKDPNKRFGILLPNGDYGNSDSEAYKDYNNTATTSVPDSVRLTALLIARVPLKFSGGGDIAEFINPLGSPEIVTLLGLPLGYTSTGGVGGASFIPTLEQVTTIGAITAIKMSYTVQQAFTDPFDIIDKGYADTKMNWENKWQPITYYTNDVVVDGDWTMVANKETVERAAPQPNGDPTYAIPVPPVWVEQSAIAVIQSGHTYTFTKGGWLKEIRIWAPELSSTIHYRIIIINLTDPGNPVTSIIQDPLLTEDGWAVVQYANAVVTVGTVLRVFIDVINSGASQQVTGQWNYTGVDNSNPPAAQSWNRNQQHSLVRIDNFDTAPADRYLELLGVVPNSTITIIETAIPTNSYTYTTISGSQDGTTFVSYQVELTSQGGLGPTVGEETSITIDIPVSQPTKYVEDQNYWLTGQPDWASVVGYLTIDGVEQVGIIADSAYGVDMKFQEAYVSPDWDLLASSSGGGGGGGDVTVSTFLALSDTPGAYIANQLVAVNTAADALEFISPAGLQQDLTSVLGYGNSDVTHTIIHKLGTLPGESALRSEVIAVTSGLSTSFLPYWNGTTLVDSSLISDGTNSAVPLGTYLIWNNNLTDISYSTTINNTDIAGVYAVIHSASKTSGPRYITFGGRAPTVYEPQVNLNVQTGNLLINTITDDTINKLQVNGNVALVGSSFDSFTVGVGWTGKGRFAGYAEGASYITANIYYDGNFNLDDITKGGTVISSSWATPFRVRHAVAAANPVTPIELLNLDLDGTLQHTSAGGVATNSALLSDVTGAIGTLINPTDNYIPFRTSVTTFGNSPFYVNAGDVTIGGTQTSYGSITIEEDGSNEGFTIHSGNFSTSRIWVDETNGDFKFTKGAGTTAGITITQTDFNTLIGTNINNGVDKLQVAGSGTFSGSVTAAGGTLTENLILTGSNRNVVINSDNNAGLLLNRSAANYSAAVEYQTAGSQKWAAGLIDSDSGDSGSYFIGQSVSGATPAMTINISNNATFSGIVTHDPATLDEQSATLGQVKSVTGIDNLTTPNVPYWNGSSFLDSRLIESDGSNLDTLAASSKIRMFTSSYQPTGTTNPIGNFISGLSFHPIITDYEHQISFIAGYSDMWIRHAINSTTFNDWIKIYSSDNSNKSTVDWAAKDGTFSGTVTADENFKAGKIGLAGSLWLARASDGSSAAGIVEIDVSNHLKLSATSGGSNIILNPANILDVQSDATFSGSVEATTNIGIGTTPTALASPASILYNTYSGDGFPHLALKRENGSTKTNAVYNWIIGSGGNLIKYHDSSVIYNYTPSTTLHDFTGDATFTGTVTASDYYGNWEGQSTYFFNHRNYTDATNYLGGYYLVGGGIKPNNTVLGAGKFKVLMDKDSGVNGNTWMDILWTSGYNGGDVKSSNAIWMSKQGVPEMYFTQQDFDSSTWGTANRIWHSGNSTIPTTSNFVPYSLATANVDLGIYDLAAAEIKANGGGLISSREMKDGTNAFLSPHLALIATNTVDTTGFVGMTYATSTSTNYGFSVGSQRTSAGQGNFKIRSHQSSSAGTELFNLDWTGNATFSGSVTAGGVIKTTSYGQYGIDASMFTGAGNIISGSYTSTDYIMYNTGGDLHLKATGNKGLEIAATTGNATFSGKLTSNYSGWGIENEVFRMISTSSSSIYNSIISESSSGAAYNAIVFNVSNAVANTQVETLRLTGDGNATFSGSVTALGGNSTNWNTAYGWGNHSGLYHVKSSNGQTDPDLVRTQSSYRFDPHANNPTNSYYGIITYGNGSNVTGQLATHFTTGDSYVRAYNTSWSTWAKILTTSNFTTTNYVPYSGATANVDLGIYSIAAVNLNYAGTSLAPVATNGIRISTNADRTVDIGCRNTTYCHFSTTASLFYMYQSLTLGSGKTVTAANFILGTSERRFKREIEPVSNKSIADIQLKQFIYKEDKENRLHYGAIIEEVEPIAPEFIYVNKDGKKSLGLVDLLAAKVAFLEEEVKQLKSRI